MITIDDFKKVELKVAKIIHAEKIENSEKLLRLEVNLGDEKRQILSGISQFYTPEEMIGKRIIIVANLEPRRMMGLESQGMILAAEANGKPILLTTEEDIEPGASIL